MREIPRSDGEVRGSIPRGGSGVSDENHSLSPDDAAPGEVKIAKVVDIAPGMVRPPKVGSWLEFEMEGEPGRWHRGRVVSEEDHCWGVQGVEGYSGTFTVFKANRSGWRVAPEKREVPEARRCKSCQAVGEVTFLGVDHVGDECTFCQGTKCARLGCSKLRMPTSQYCSGHARAAGAAEHGGAEHCHGNLDAIREDSEQPNDKRRGCAEVMDGLYEDFYEGLWQALAEETDLDPVTVAACKRVRDDERAVRGRR